MGNRKDIIERCREAIAERLPRPSLDDLRPTVYADPLEQFKITSTAMGCRVETAASASEADAIIRRAYPDAQLIASALPEITIATRNPDPVESAQALNGTDVGVVRGTLGVAENGCIWVPQTMKERDVCFISENLVVLLPASCVVSNMHEAYARVKVPESGYATFIAGPSKTADIAQVLVTGAQAARTMTVILLENE